MLRVVRSQSSLPISRRCASNVRPSAVKQDAACEASAPSSLPSSFSPKALLAAAVPLAVLAGGVGAAHAAPEVVGSLAGLDGSQAALLKNILGPVLNIVTFLMIVRIVMTWYPEIDGKAFPWSIAYTPTEPVLSVTRKIVPPLSGVDISPIVWVGLISFFSETIVGPQGLLSLIERQGGL